MAKYPADTQLPIGTTKQLFDSTYIYIDPQYINGLGMWRVYPGVPEAEDITGLGAILPIVSTALSPHQLKFLSILKHCQILEHQQRQQLYSQHVHFLDNLLAAYRN